MKNNNTKKNKKNKRWIRVVLTILILYVVFFIYSNFDLSKERDYTFYSNLSINDETINYSSFIINGTEPLFFPKSEEKAVLLLHGMGGTPIEIAELAGFLADKNITVLVPLLSNQGRTYSKLNGLEAEEIYQESLIYLSILKKNYNQVYVGGLSTGGSVALKIAENNEVDGIITLAAPITYGFSFLGDSTLLIFKFLDKITPNLRRIEWGLAKDSSVADKLPSFDRLPVKVLIQGEILKKETKENLGLIQEPILILQSKSDNRAAPSSAKYIFDKVSSVNKTLVYLNNSGHVITMDYDKQKVFSEVYNFILKY